MNERPTGISILAILFLFGGLALIAMQLFLAGPLSSTMEQIGVSSLLSMAAIGFLGVLSLAAGIGMWTGRKWGWWLGALYLFYSVARNANALLVIPELVREFGDPEGGVGKYYFKHGVRIFVNSLLILYFFNPNVVDYFQVGEISPWRRFSLLFVMAAGIMALFFVGSRLGIARSAGP